MAAALEESADNDDEDIRLGNDNDNNDDESSQFSLRSAMRPILSLAAPMIASEFFQNTLPLTDLAFVGRLLSKEDLAAAALATVWFNLWNATMLGFCTALDTLLSQASGAKQQDTLSHWTGHGLFLVTIATAIMAGLLGVTGPVMEYIGRQDEILSERAGEFSYRLIPGLFPYYWFKVLLKHLQTQDVVLPGVLIGILANAVNVALNWTLIQAWGLSGAPVATTLTRYFEFGALVVVYYFFRGRSSSTYGTIVTETWPKCRPRDLWSQRDATGTRRLAVFLKLAGAGALSFTAEAWSFEITTLLAGLLGTIELDAHILTLSIATFLYLSFPFAISVAASIQVGQWTGAGRFQQAQLSAKASFVLTAIVQASLIIMVWPSSGLLGDLFSSEEEVSSLVATLLPLSCVFMMGDSIQSTAGGVMRGMGRQRLVFWLNVIGFWILAVPVGAILTFVADVGVEGLWWGMSVGIYSSSSLGLFLLCYRIDWKSETTAAKNRMSVSGTADVLELSSGADAIS